MMPTHRWRVVRVLGAAALIGAAACARRAEPLLRPAPASLPPLMVEQVTPPPRARPNQEPAEPGALSGGAPITLRLNNADVRLLLPVLANAAGMSLVMGPEVTGRVSVQLREVPVREALRVVLEESGLHVVRPLVPPWSPVIFYDPPANIDRLTAPEIQHRYNVSAEVAAWMVASRQK